MSSGRKQWQTMPQQHSANLPVAPQQHGHPSYISYVATHIAMNDSNSNRHPIVVEVSPHHCQAGEDKKTHTHTHTHTSHSLSRIGLSRPTVTPLTALLPPAVRSIDLAPDILSSFAQLSCSLPRQKPRKTKKSHAKNPEDDTQIKTKAERRAKSKQKKGGDGRDRRGGGEGGGGQCRRKKGGGGNG